MTTKILVADDSATMRRVLEMTFAGEDAEVVSVPGGEAAVQKAGEIAPDVIFADASMDGVDALCAEISGAGVDVEARPLAFQMTPYPDTLRKRLIRAPTRARCASRSSSRRARRAFSKIG